METIAVPLIVAIVGVVPLLLGRQVRRSAIDKDLDILAKLPNESQVRSDLLESIEMRVDELINPSMKRFEWFMLALCPVVVVGLSASIAVRSDDVDRPAFFVPLAWVAIALYTLIFCGILWVNWMRKRLKSHRRRAGAGAAARPLTPEPAAPTTDPGQPGSRG